MRRDVWAESRALVHHLAGTDPSPAGFRARKIASRDEPRSSGIQVWLSLRVALRLPPVPSPRSAATRFEKLRLCSRVAGKVAIRLSTPSTNEHLRGVSCEVLGARCEQCRTESEMLWQSPGVLYIICWDRPFACGLRGDKKAPRRRRWGVWRSGLREILRLPFGSRKSVEPYVSAVRSRSKGIVTRPRERANTFVHTVHKPTWVRGVRCEVRGVRCECEV